MPIHDFECNHCKLNFEALVRSQDPEPTCPKCQSTDLERKIPKFRIGGRGDLRESTFHGCHDTDVPMKGDNSVTTSAPNSDSHKCGSGCKH